MANPAPALISLPAFGCVPADWLALVAELPLLPVGVLPPPMKFVTVSTTPPERLVVITTNDEGFGWPLVDESVPVVEGAAVVDELVYARPLVEMLAYMEVMVGTGVRKLSGAVGGGDCGIAALLTGLRARVVERRKVRTRAVEVMSCILSVLRRGD